MEKRLVELKKHVGIIHCANNLTLLQRKLANVLLYYAYGNLLSQEKHKIKIGELKKLIDYNSHDTDILKKAFKALMSVVLEWNLLEKAIGADDTQYINQQEREEKKNKYSWHASSILASAKISKDVCTYSYSPELRELLYMPEIYGRINLFVQSRFSSTYSLALYENCVRFRKIGRTGWISCEVFRRLMGISKGKYKKYKDFKRRVLDKAVEEINKLSDISVFPELKRDCGKQTFFIRFFIKSNTEFQKITTKCNLSLDEKKNDDGDMGDNQILCMLKNQFCLSQGQIRNIIDNYGIAYILNKVDLIQNSTSYKNNKIANIAAYFLSALKENFKLPESKLIIKNTDAGSDKKRNLEAEKKLEQDYNNYMAAKISFFLEKVDIEKKNEVNEAFHKEMSKSPIKFIIEEYSKSGMKSSLVQAFHRDFIRKNYCDLIGIASFDNFIKNIEYRHKDV